MTWRPGLKRRCESDETTLSALLERIQALVAKGEVRISLHGYDELASEGIAARAAVSGLRNAVVVEEYPDYPKGPCVLVLERDSEDRAIHVLWGIQAGKASPAVIITAYRPNPRKWDATWMKRRT